MDHGEKEYATFDLSRCSCVAQPVRSNAWLGVISARSHDAPAIVGA